MNFVCVYYGKKYQVEYVQHLYNMVERHTRVPYNFICFNNHEDLALKVKGDIEYRRFHYTDFDGWWNKLQLFSPEAGLVGPNLYMDLYVVILDDIDDLFTFGDDQTFGVIRDFNPSTKQYNSSIMKWNNTVGTPCIWEPYLLERDKWNREQGDQNVMSLLMQKHGQRWLRTMPDEWTFSYKWNNRIEPRYHKNDWTFEKVSESKVAVFHGKPNPHESEQEWVKSNWC